MKPINKFSSVHDYLDQVFRDIAPSPELIALEKKRYWRAYNTDLKRRQRKEFTTLHVRFTKKELQEFKATLTENESMHSKVKKILENYLTNEETSRNVNTPLIQQQVFLISEYIEEWKDEQAIDAEKLQQLESCILAIEKAILE